MLEVHRLFRNRFGFPPTYTVEAPGTVELLGNYADLHHGIALAMSVDRSVSIAVAARTDGKVELAPSRSECLESFSVLDTAPGHGSPTASQLKSMLNALRQRQAHCSGFSTAIHSTIPTGSGLGSSSALKIAAALAVRQLHPFTLTATGITVPPKRAADGALPPLSNIEKLEIARTCLLTGNTATPEHSGLLAPVASLFSKEFHAVEIDCQSFTIEPAPLIGEIAWVLCDTGIRHAEIDKTINDLRAECDAATRALGVKSLRSVDASFLNANRQRLNDRQFQCASHLVGETQRVVAATHALRDGDFAQFGQFMYQSHESSRDLFGNSCAELDELVALAKIHPGCLGARLTGRGFGGSTLNLVHSAQADSFAKAISTVYEKRTGRRITPLICKPADGAN